MDGLEGSLLGFIEAPTIRKPCKWKRNWKMFLFNSDSCPKGFDVLCRELHSRKKKRGRGGGEDGNHGNKRTIYEVVGGKTIWRKGDMVCMSQGELHSVGGNQPKSVSPNNFVPRCPSFFILVKKATFSGKERNEK